MALAQMPGGLNALGGAGGAGGGAGAGGGRRTYGGRTEIAPLRLALPALARLSALRHHRQPHALINICVYIDADPVISKLGVLALLPNIASAIASLDSTSVLPLSL